MNNICRSLLFSRHLFISGYLTVKMLMLYYKYKHGTAYADVPRKENI